MTSYDRIVSPSLPTAAPVQSVNGQTGAVKLPVTDMVDITAAPYNCVGDGVTNNSAGLDAARTAANGRWLYAPKGNYLLNTAGTANGFPLRLMGDGPGQTIFTQGTADINTFSVVGSAGATFTPTADIASGAQSISLPSTTGLSVGDYINIRSLKAWPNTDKGATYGELARIYAINTSTNVVTLGGPTNWAYAVADTVTVEKQNMVADGLDLRDFTLVNGSPNTKTQPAVFTKRVTGINVENVHFTKCDGPGVQTQITYGGTFDRLKFRDFSEQYTSNRFGYGIDMREASRDFRVSNCLMDGGRHLFTPNAYGSGTLCWGIPSHATIVNCEATNMYEACFDTHIEGSDITYIGCKAHGTRAFAFQLRGQNTGIIDCEVTNAGVGAIVRASATGSFIRGLKGKEIRTSSAGNPHLVTLDTNAPSVVIENVYGRGLDGAVVDVGTGAAPSVIAGITGVNVNAGVQFEGTSANHIVGRLSLIGSTYGVNGPSTVTGVTLDGYQPRTVTTDIAGGISVTTPTAGQSFSSALTKLYATAVSSQPATGQKVVTLASVTNLAAGWIVVLGADQVTAERLTVASVSGNNVTFTTNIVGTHPTTELVTYSNVPLDQDYMSLITNQQVTGTKRFTNTLTSTVIPGTLTSAVGYALDGTAAIRSRASGGGSIIAVPRAETKPVIDWINDSTNSGGYLLHLTQSLPSGTNYPGANGASSGTLLAIGVQGSGGTGILLAHDGPNGNLIFLDQKGVVTNSSAAAVAGQQGSFNAPLFSLVINEPSPSPVIALSSGSHVTVPGERVIQWSSSTLPVSGLGYVDTQTGWLVNQQQIVADSSINNTYSALFYKGKGNTNRIWIDEQGPLAGGSTSDSGPAVRFYTNSSTNPYSSSMRMSKTTQGLHIATSNGAARPGAETAESVADFGTTSSGVRLGFGHDVNVANLAVPSSVVLSGAGATGGSSTYGYRVAAVNSRGTTIASTTVSTAAGQAALSAGSPIIVTWAASLGANSYKVYGRTAGSELLLGTVSVPTRTLTDGVMYAAATRTVTDGVVSLPSGAGSSANVTSATANFTSADVGAKISISGGNEGLIGAGYNGYQYNGHIVSVTNSTTAVVSGVLGASVTGATVVVSNPAMNRITSATAAFTIADVGRGVSAPVGTSGATTYGVITTYESATSVLVDFTATTAMTAGTFTITGGTVPLSFTDDGTVTPSGALPGNPAGTGFKVQRWASQTGALVTLQDETGAALLTFDKQGRPVAGGGAPTISAGSSSTALSTSGVDMAHSLALTTAAGAAAGATVATISFSTAYGSAPKAIVLTPTNAASAGAVYISAKASGSYAIALVAATASATALAYDVHVIG